MRPARALAAFAAVLAVSLSLASSGPARADDPAGGGDEVRIDLSKEMRIPDLLNLLAANTGRPVFWSTEDKAISTKKIGGTDGAVIKVPKRRLLSVVRGLLSTQEIVLIPLGPVGSESFMAVDARALASQYLIKVRPQLIELTDQNVAEFEREEGLFVAATIHVSSFESLRGAGQALRHLSTQNNIGSVMEVPEARAFFVSDFAPNVAQIWRSVRLMDAAAEKRRPRALTLSLAHARAEKLASVLLELWTPAPSGQPAAPGALPGSRPRIAADPATNRLVLVASPEDLETLSTVVKDLDQPEKPAR